MNGYPHVLKLNLYFILFVCVLIFGFSVTTTVAHEGGESEVKIIHMNEDGFDPAHATVTAGTKVIFENAGGQQHWPASDNHPNHTHYDGTRLQEHCTKESSKTFDACESIEPNESWSFVFKKTGSFSYHDHLWPHRGGKIVVKGEAQKQEGDGVIARTRRFLARLFIKPFKNLFGNKKQGVGAGSAVRNDTYLSQLSNRYKKIVREKDPGQAISRLREEASKKPKTSSLCHDVLHEIGHAGFAKHGSFQEAVRFQSDYCNSGYIHGVFEEYFKQAEDPLSNITKQCKQYAAENGRAFDLWQCYHGIGHGLMYLTGGELDRSLNLCKEELDTGAVSSCHNGVYMEVFNREVLAKEKAFVDEQEPFATCKDRDVAKSDCYLYVPSYLYQTKQVEFSEIFDACESAEYQYNRSCIYGVGAEALKRNMSDPASVFPLCSEAGAEGEQQACAAGVVGMYMNQRGEYKAGRELCKQAPKKFKKTCNNAVEDKRAFFENI